MIKLIKEPYKPVHLKSILHPFINQWFFSKFKDFSLPQLYGVMEIHNRKNVLISAPTGATKTLTGFLAVLNELVDSAEKKILEDKVYCVYISPLKALNNDIQKNLKEPLEEIEKIAGKDLGIRVGVRTGDTTQYEKSKMLKKPPHILITTPESLAIMLNSPKFKEHLTKVQWLIIDEIHAMDNKRGTYLSLTLERLNEVSKTWPTKIGLSATVEPMEEVAKFLVGIGDDREVLLKRVEMRKKIDIQVLTPGDLIYDSELHTHMYELMDDLINKHKTTLIFTNTRSATERVVKLVEGVGEVKIKLIIK